MSCDQKPSKPSAPFSSLTPCQQLDVVTDALHALGTGKTKVTVRHGDFWVEYAAGNIAFLERERRRLERLCGRNRGNYHAITIGRTKGGWRCQ